MDPDPKRLNPDPVIYELLKNSDMWNDLHWNSFRFYRWCKTNSLDYFVRPFVITVSLLSANRSLELLFRQVPTKDITSTCARAPIASIFVVRYIIGAMHHTFDTLKTVWFKVYLLNYTNHHFSPVSSRFFKASHPAPPPLKKKKLPKIHEIFTRLPLFLLCTPPFCLPSFFPIATTLPLSISPPLSTSPPPSSCHEVSPQASMCPKILRSRLLIIHFYTGRLSGWRGGGYVAW